MARSEDGGPEAVRLSDTVTRVGETYSVDLVGRYITAMARQDKDLRIAVLMTEAQARTLLEELQKALELDWLEREIHG